MSADTDRRYLTLALALIVGFMCTEVAVGLFAGSLALLSDAGHMLTDAAALGLALTAMRLAARPATGRWTYGYKRAEVLSAQANGLTLIGLAAWFTWEAINRLIAPAPVAGKFVMATAAIGIVVNLAAAWLIGRANRASLNVEGAFQHIRSDLWAFAATLAAGLTVLLTGFDRADPIAALAVAALMVKAGTVLVRESARIFMEAAPAGVDPQEIARTLAARPHVSHVHDLHIWEITSGMVAASAHVLVPTGHDCHAVRSDCQQILAHTYGITHTTLQVDHARDELLTIAPACRFTAAEQPANS